MINFYQNYLFYFYSSLFRNYWRKSFYNFFHFHFEHLSFNPNTRWYIELWFTYIQKWKFHASNNCTTGGTEAHTIHNGDFINENYFIFNDIYQLVLRRFCICDLTNEENLQLLTRILLVSGKIS